MTVILTPEEEGELVTALEDIRRGDFEDGWELLKLLREELAVVDQQGIPESGD